MVMIDFVSLKKLVVGSSEEVVKVKIVVSDILSKTVILNKRLLIEISAYFSSLFNGKWEVGDTVVLDFSILSSLNDKNIDLIIYEFISMLMFLEPPQDCLLLRWSFKLLCDYLIIDGQLFQPSKMSDDKALLYHFNTYSDKLMLKDLLILFRLGNTPLIESKKSQLFDMYIPLPYDEFIMGKTGNVSITRDDLNNLLHVNGTPLTVYYSHKSFLSQCYVEIFNGYRIHLPIKIQSGSAYLQSTIFTAPIYRQQATQLYVFSKNEKWYGIMAYDETEMLKNVMLFLRNNAIERYHESCLPKFTIL